LRYDGVERFGHAIASYRILYWLTNVDWAFMPAMKSAALVILTVILLEAGKLCSAQTNTPPSAKELEMIAERGRALAEYDTAAWHATDAARAGRFDEDRVRRYLARKTEAGWTVAFGKLNDAQSAFLVAYETTAAKATGPFHVRTNHPPQEDRNYFLRMARAIDIALAHFGVAGRPYNVAALPARQDEWFVYLVPAPTEPGVWPLGGDARYRVSADGLQILESNRLHNSILEFGSKNEKGKSIEFGFSTVVTADHPWETDVFHVLTREPRVRQYVVTEHFVYGIDTNGAVHYLMTTEEFRKDKRSEKRR
jgi:hypothetical protein